MAHIIVDDLDLSTFQLLNARLQNLGTAPTGAAGRFYFNTATNRFNYHNGTAFVDPQDRANHSGSQLASTISDFNTAVRTNTLNQLAAPTAAVSMNGQLLTNLATPVAATDAANRQFVIDQAQASAAGLDAKESVRVATTANITLSGTQTIDGVTVAVGNRVLVKNQTAGAENGIYLVASGAWTRTADASQGTLTSRAFTFVEEGGQAGTQWVLSNTGTITVGTTAINWTQFGGGTAYGAGNGLTLTGNTFSVITPANSGIVVAAAGVSVDTALVVRKAVFASTAAAAGAATTYTHNLNTQDVTVGIRRVADGALVQATVIASTVSAITVAFGAAVAADQYRIVVHG